LQRFYEVCWNRITPISLAETKAELLSPPPIGYWLREVGLSHEPMLRDRHPVPEINGPGRLAWAVRERDPPG
jgi:hypothetical protein